MADGSVTSFYNRWKTFPGDGYTKDSFDSKLVEVGIVKRKLKKIPEEFYSYTGLPVITPTNFTQWSAEVLQGNTVMLHELMSGSGRLSLACCMAGHAVACPIDFRYQWNLKRPEHQQLVDTVKSTVDYGAPSCGPWSCLGGFHSDETVERTRLSE